MDGLFYILLAAAAGLFVWGVIRAFLSGGGDRRKLYERLSNEGRTYTIAGSDGDSRSIVLQSAEEVSALTKALVKRSFFQSVQRQLNVAWPGITLARFLVVVSFCGVMTLLVTFLLTDSAFMSLVAGLFVGYLPFMFVSGKVSKRNRLLAEQLPEGLDFLSRILRAGHSFSTGLQMMGTELPEPLASEFRRCYDQHSLGQPLEDCLKDMANRVESTDFAFFVTAVLIQRQTGGDLSMVLGNISAMVRGRIRLASYVKAKTAEGRLTGYVLVGFPLLMFFVSYSMNPEYAGKLLHTPVGQKLLGAAVGLQVLGLFAIRKLTTVKV